MKVFTLVGVALVGTVVIASELRHTRTYQVVQSAPNAVADVVTGITCSDASDQAALDQLFPQLGMDSISNYLDVWLSHDYDESYWNPRLKCQQEIIDKLRVWSKSEKDTCLRRGYEHWLDYYQGELDSARNELRTHTQQKEMDQYEADRERERRASEDYLHRVAAGTPPHECCSIER